MNGLILCGGQSSRLGFDKLNIQKDGITLHEWWKNNLKSYCTNVFLSCNQSIQSKYLLDSCILDITPAQGPLGGIISMIRQDSLSPIFLTAVDLCYITKKDINYLLNNRNFNKKATLFNNSESNTVFPLFTIIETTIFPQIIEEYQSERKSLLKVLQSSNVEIVERLIDTRGINSPNEYQDYLSRIESQSF